ncbi:helix-turn-helix domain-containing protein, partial [Vibrio alginolyticus]
ENKHNMSAAARHLGISRTTLYRLIKKYNLNV